MSTDQKLVPVKYLGLKPRKTDNVTGSDYVWEGPGAVVQVPEHIAQRLLSQRYATVWGPASAVSVAERISAQQAADARAAHMANQQAQRDALALKAAKPPAPAQTQVSAQEQQALIIDAMAKVLMAGEFGPSGMDPDTGIPTMESVSNILGRAVGVDEHNAAWNVIVTTGK